VEPTAAAAAAGLTRLLGAGAIRPDEATVVVLTGSGLKASAAIGDLLGLGARRQGSSVQ
jgi:threonine synthase